MTEIRRPLAWITGAHGFIGRHLARALAGQGIAVAGLGHGAWAEQAAAKWGVSTWLNGDVAGSNFTQLRAVSGDPDTIYHLAGGSSVGAAIAQPQEDFFRTVVSTMELLEWVRNNAPQARIVAVSSAAVYGAGHSGPIHEDAALTPFSPYGYHKRMMEDLCRSYGASFGLSFVVPRLFSVYGSGLRKQLLWDICVKLSKNPESIALGGTGNEIRDWVHVEDVAKALIACTALAAPAGPVVNVASGVPLRVADVADLMVHHWTSKVGARSGVEFSGQSRPGDPFSLLADITRLNDLVPTVARTTADGFGSFVDWYLSQSEGEA